MALNSLHHTFINVVRPSFLGSGVRLKFPSKVCVAFMTSKELRDPTIEKPKPWPYETKRFTYLHSVFDRTTKRFDENTKLIVVDGNIGAGKTTFAKKLAEEFDLKYVPEPDMDRRYITPYGFDLRIVDNVMPPAFKACDLKIFYSNPHHPNVTKFQYQMFMYRFGDYIDALAHILNTGQGVIMDRSVYSDIVFMEAMHEAGYIRTLARDLYRDIYDRCIARLMRPHLVVYLDVPVDTVMERIKARNNPSEVNSKVLTKDYLQTIDDVYKESVLKKLSEHSEILVYDWSHYGDMDVVVEDVEQIDFEKYTRYDKKLKDWRREDHWEWSYLRRLYTSRKKRVLYTARIFRPAVTEVYIPNDDRLEYEELCKKIPGMRFEEGFNADQGDNVLFKLMRDRVR